MCVILVVFVVCKDNLAWITKCAIINFSSLTFNWHCIIWIQWNLLSIWAVNNVLISVRGVQVLCLVLYTLYVSGAWTLDSVLSSLVPRPHPLAWEKDLVNLGKKLSPRAGICAFQSDHSFSVIV